MVKYEKLTCSLLGLQGKFPMTYFAGIENTEVYNEVMVFEVDQAIYVWKELRFRQSHRSLTELSKEAFERMIYSYQRMSSSKEEKNRYRKITFDACVGGGEYIPLQIDKNTRLFLQTNNLFRKTIEKMLADQ